MERSRGFPRPMGKHTYHLSVGMIDMELIGAYAQCSMASRQCLRVIV